ncbi:MAG: histidine phosphatase family protein [Clostridia bacterium]|nr:histidine phosphatase family protein [Clostridia bacterium]
MLYIIRHGKTDWNELRLLQGQTDIPLNDAGRAMAKEAALKYADVHFDICYCSPLRRALETANILLEGRDVPVVTDERLLEMSFGIYEGMPGGFDDPSLPVHRLFTDPCASARAEGGESFEELFCRTAEFLREVVEPELERGRDVLIVGHGASNTSIVCQRKNVPIEKFWTVEFLNCKLYEI